MVKKKLLLGLLGIVLVFIVVGVYRLIDFWEDPMTLGESVLYHSWYDESNCVVSIDEAYFLKKCPDKSAEKTAYKLKKKYYKKIHGRRILFLDIEMMEEEWTIVFPYGRDVTIFEMENKTTHTIETYDLLA